MPRSLRFTYVCVRRTNPSDVALESFKERPVLAELTGVLLLPHDDERFTSCVVVHGMGGTGKTVTAVAAVRDPAVRHLYSEIYWLTVGADAMGEKVKQLQAMMYKQLTGKEAKVHEKDEHELQQMLVAAIAVKFEYGEVHPDSEYEQFQNETVNSISDFELKCVQRQR